MRECCGVDAARCAANIASLAAYVTCLLALTGMIANAQPAVFNLTGTFQDGSSFGPGSQITVDPSQLSGSDFLVSAVNVTLLGPSGQTLATYNQRSDVVSSAQESGVWTIGFCTDFQLVFVPPQGTGEECDSFPQVYITLPVSLMGYAGGPLCLNLEGGCGATYYTPAENASVDLVTGWLIPAGSGATNLPRFAYPVPAGAQVSAVAIDSSGNTFLTGQVTGNAIAATSGAFQTQDPASSNGFVMELNVLGAVVFATYLGGSEPASPTSIAVDASDNIYVAGNLAPAPNASAPIFPVTPGAAFTSGAGGFIAKLNPAGTQLIYATLIPNAVLGPIALDAAGEVYFAGAWTSANFGSNLFPATAGAFQSKPEKPQGSPVLGKLNASGSALVYGTYLGGSQGPTAANAIALDASGNLLAAGTTQASDFPATSGQFIANDPNNDNLFLAKINSTGSGLIYSSLLGIGSTVAMKPSPQGDIYIIANAPANFPVTAAGFGVAAPTTGLVDFLLHLASDGVTVLDSLYLPFVADDLDVDAQSNAYLSGNIGGQVIQASEGAFQSAYAPFEKPSTIPIDEDGVVAKITSTGQIAGATYFGPSALNTITAEQDGSVAVSGSVYAPGFLGISAPSTPGIFYFAANFFPAVTVENSASYAANAVAAGEEVAIQGYGLGPITGAVSSPVSSLAGVQVYFDNFAAPITYAQAQQINVQVPWEIAGESSTTMRIVFNGAEAGRATVPVQSALPGVFWVASADGYRNTSGNPAHAGGLASLYGTGGGATNPAGVTGALWPATPLSFLTQPVSVTVGGLAATVLYAGSAPTLDSGYFQVNFQLPANLTGPTQPVVVTIGGVASVPAAISIE